MNHLDHTAFIIACRDERGVGHHTLRTRAPLHASPKPGNSPILTAPGYRRCFGSIARLLPRVGQVITRG